MSDTAIRVRVTGRVQGVGFRAWTRINAEALGLTGWVRNTDDGAVEAEICGTATQVAEMQSRLSGGPRGASVRRVTAQTVPAQASNTGFLILR